MRNFTGQGGRPAYPEVEFLTFAPHHTIASVREKVVTRGESGCGTTRTRRDVDDPVGNQVISGPNRDEQGGLEYVPNFACKRQKGTRLAVIMELSRQALDELPHASWSSSALASCRTGVSKPSVNQP